MKTKNSTLNNKKAIEMGISMVIMMIVALLVLLVVAMFFMGGFGEAGGGVTSVVESTSAQASGADIASQMGAASSVWNPCVEYYCTGDDIICKKEDGTITTKKSCSAAMCDTTLPNTPDSACCSDGAGACLAGTSYTP